MLLLLLLGLRLFTIVHGGILRPAVVQGLVQVRELRRGVFTILIYLLHWLESKRSSGACLVIVSECVLDKSIDEVGLLQIYTGRRQSLS